MVAEPTREGRLREADGAISWETFYAEYSRWESIVGINEWTTNERIEQLRIGSNKQRFQYCFASTIFLYLRAIQGRSVKQKVDRKLQDIVKIPEGFFHHIYHVGSSHNLHSIILSVLIARGKDGRQGRQTVFSSAVNREKRSIWTGQKIMTWRSNRMKN